MYDHSDGGSYRATRLRSEDPEEKVGNLSCSVWTRAAPWVFRERMTATWGPSSAADRRISAGTVGLVVFRGDRAELLLSPPAVPRWPISTWLLFPPAAGLPGPRTGVGAGHAEELPGPRRALPLLVLVSDGRANVGRWGRDPVGDAEQVAKQIKAAGIRAIAVDTERDVVSFGLVRRVCEEMGGTYLRLEELRAEPIISAVRKETYRSREGSQA